MRITPILVLLAMASSCVALDISTPDDSDVHATSAMESGEPEAGSLDTGAVEDVTIHEAEPEAIVTHGPTVLVSDIMAPMPYRNRRYVARCRREARRDAPAAITVEDRDEARRRARALARAGMLDPVLVFARMSYGEAGTPLPGRNDDDYYGMLAVMDAQRGAMSRVEMFVNYSPRRIFPMESDVRMRWIAELQIDGSRPPSWPAPRHVRRQTAPSWAAYGCPRWLATVDAVKRLLRSHNATVGAGPCTEVPHHWGGTMDTPRALRMGWRRISCGTTVNGFWVVPSRAKP